MSGSQPRPTLKQKFIREMIEYWMNFAYLALLFAAFIQYGRLILAAHEITYTNYFFAVIEAAILAKIVMIGEVARLGRGLEHRPLIYPTLYKTASSRFSLRSLRPPSTCSETGGTISLC